MSVQSLFQLYGGAASDPGDGRQNQYGPGCMSKDATGS